MLLLSVVLFIALSLLNSSDAFLSNRFMRRSVLLKQQVSNDLNVASLSGFAQFQGLPEWLLESCVRLNYTTPTSVQQLSIPEILEGKDVIVQAQTGSGKTLVFALPLLAKIDPSRAAIQAVIVAPTRELGLQVAGVLKQLAFSSPEKIMVMPVLDGSYNRRQQLWAVAEPPHIVIGNPKSLQRLVDMGRLRLNAVEYVVVDEVDACLLRPESKLELHNLLSRHLSNSYLDDEAIDANKQKNFHENRVYRDQTKDDRQLSSTFVQYNNHRQTILCSATIPQRKHFAEAAFKNGWTETVPEIINLSIENQLTPSHIKHECVYCNKEDRLPTTTYLLTKELKDISSNTTDKQVLVFVDNVDEISQYADYIYRALSKKMQLNENAVDILSPTMDIDSRRAALDNFRRGECQVLLCSELAARGLDIPNISLVIQMNVPKYADDYLHRAGRTGRFNRPGKVITLLTEDEDFVISRFMNELGFTVKKRTVTTKSKGTKIDKGKDDE